MYKIGDFSKLSKVTVKALRYYEREGLLLPAFVDLNGYRYYEASQLIDLAKIVSLRQVGCSIDEIKQIQHGADFNTVIANRKQALENEIQIHQAQLSKINYLLEEKSMKYEVITKKLPECIVYFKEGTVKDFSEITDFILSGADECLKTNPNIKCVSPDYCFVNYLDGEFKEKDFRIRYSQAVTEMGIENDTVKFSKLEAVDAVCVYHKGAYESLGEAYAFIMKYIEENGLTIADNPRERYIDGIWNKENVEDWLTEIQVPIKTK